MCTYDGTKMRMYVNGVKQTDEATFDIYGNSLSDNIAIGAYFTNLLAYYNFNGKIDEVMIFDTNLSSSEVEAIYNRTSPRFKSSGTQTLKFENVSGLNGVTIDANFQVNFNNTYSDNLDSSKMEARVGYWNVDLGYNESDFGSNNNLTAYWHADGDANDSIGGINLTLQGDAVANEYEGLFDSSFGFDGVGDIINGTSPTSLNISTNISYGAWFKKDNFTLTAGNAGNILVLINGNTRGKVGKKGEVIDSLVISSDFNN